jgi:hypothetical protein
MVYPGLLSRVADAFKQKVVVQERGKDGLSLLSSTMLNSHG